MEWIYVMGLKQKEQNGVDLCYGLEAERTKFTILRDSALTGVKPIEFQREIVIFMNIVLTLYLFESDSLLYIVLSLRMVNTIFSQNITL
jgi:hypothetical protein